MKILFTVILFVHALIHLMGFVKAFGLAEIKELTMPVSKPSGIIWLATAILFLISLLFFLIKKDTWWIIGAVAVILSQILIIMTWHDARFGTLANVIVLIAVLIAAGNWQFNRMVRSEVRTFMPSSLSKGIPVRDSAIALLPPVVQKWLKHSGVIGKEPIQTVHLYQTGQMRTKPDAKWMPFKAEQWFRTEDPGFIWKAKVNAPAGLKMIARDQYKDGKGHMLIKLASLIPVADVKNKETDQGSLLRYLAELAWFPSSALEPYLRWEEVDSLSAKVTMTYGGIEASGIYRYTQEGDMVSFEAKRYYNRKGGATLEDWHIQVDPDGYREFDGIRIPVKSTVTWKLKEGALRWLELEVTEVRYNQ
ncbi:MAG: hypothetical protein JW830_11890 [Bacteroidales bacterium]|nr:hypothetical protein [Bacteroidales bacterium]